MLITARYNLLQIYAFYTRTENGHVILNYISTVNLVLRGHLWDKEKVALSDKWPLKRGAIHMKCSMTVQEKVIF